MGHTRIGHGLEMMRVVHAHRKRGGTVERLCHHRVLGRSHATHHRAYLFFHSTRWRTRPEQTQHIRRLRLDLQQLLRVTLLDVSRQMVLPPETLGAVLAQEVFASRVHHHVSADILSCVKAPIAVVTGVFLLLGSTRRLARVALEVLQERGRALVALQAHLAGEITGRGRVHSHVALVAQLCVIVFATLLALKGLFVGVVSLQVVFQVIFAVKHLFTKRALVSLLWGVCGHMPTKEDKDSL